jgi:integrase
VIPRKHKIKKVTEARPYTDKDLEFLWELVLASNDFALILAFAIGEECGLRAGETCNIRLSDIDPDEKTIFVRLPTKNGESRTVLYHDKVSKYLPLWLKQRNPACPHDHLIHGKMLAIHSTDELDKRFKKLLRTKPSPAAFLYHRLRHSWATRLMNTGMSLPVLMQLGGWKYLSSLQKYLKVLPTTVREQYEQAYQKMQEQRELCMDETMSFMEFARLEGAV